MADRRSRLAPVLLAGLIALVVGTRTFVSFLPVRVVALSQPVPVGEPALTVRLRNSRLDNLQPPFAVVARVSHHARAGARLSIDLDGSRACDVSLPAGATKRYDCAATGPWTPGAPHALTLSGPSSS